jgi:hypothetical protein
VGAELLHADRQNDRTKLIFTISHGVRVMDTLMTFLLYVRTKCIAGCKNCLTILKGRCQYAEGTRRYLAVSSLGEKVWLDERLAIESRVAANSLVSVGGSF